MDLHLLVPALVGPAATAQLDRGGVRRVLPALYLAEAAIFAALALLTRRPRGCRSCSSLAAVDGILALVGRALTRAAVAATLKPDGQLEAGNTLLNVSFSLCFAIGPALGGLVVVGFGVERRAVGQRRDLRRHDHHAGDEPLAAARARRRRRRAGSRACARASATRSATVPCAASSSPTRAPSSCAAMISPIEVIWAKEVIGGGNSAYGIVLSAWGAGTLVTGLLLVGLWRRIPVVTRIPLAAGTMGVGYVVMALATSLPVGALGCFIGGVGNGFYFVSLIQADPGPHGRRVPGPRHGPARVDHRRVLRHRVPARRRSSPR